ncbi:hypothetical protein WA171_006462 [Blastocystis sp. BT1]
MQDILAYNEKAQEWMQIGIKEMQNANLQLFVYGLEFPLFSDQNRPGKYFPIRDNCSKSDDPSVGCIYVSSYSLTTNVTLTKDYYIPFVISDGSSIVVNTTLRKSKLLKSIQSVCIRVRWNETQFVLDSPSEWSIYGDPVGCEASNRWKSVTYGKEVLDTIPIHIRHYQDPSLIASAYTKGCSDRATNSDCLGISKKEKQFIGLWWMIITFILCIVEMIVFSLMYFCFNKLPWIEHY